MITNTTLNKGPWILLNDRPAARMAMLLLLLLKLPALAQAQFTYTTNNGAITITGYTGPVGAVTIPGTINGLPVTSIGYEAFYNGASPGPGILTGVTIPSSVTSIGDYAFAWNYTLRSATLGNGLISIGEGAFADCGLTTITIPSRVAFLGDGAFAYCTSLTGVFFQGNAPSLGGSSVFAGDNNYVYYLSGTTGWGATYGGRPTARWNLPRPWIYTTNNSTITIINYIGPGGAVIIPSTINGLPVTSIGEGTFCDCTSLTDVTIPDSVTNLGDYAFQSCTSLTAVHFNGNAPSADTSVFSGDTNATVYYLAGTTGWGTTFGGRPTALGWPGTWTTTNGTITITRYTGPGGAVTIPSTINGVPVTSIGDIAFQSCGGLTSVIIPNTVTSIGVGAFQFCTSLTSVTIPNSVTNIGYEAFFSCSSLTAFAVDALNPVYSSVAGVLFDKNQTALILCPAGKVGIYTIPTTVSTIGSGAFQACAGLTGVTIPSSVTSIGDIAFRYSGLITISIPNSVTNLGAEAFGSCGVTNVTIGNGVTSIPSAMFMYCGNLCSVTMPNTVTSIGNAAFNGCASLTGVTIPDSVTIIQGDAFVGCGLTSVTIPNRVSNIGSGAFSWSSSLTNASIGNSVTDIEDDAFYGCTNLAEVYFMGNAPSLGGSSVFFNDNTATVYYLPGTSGWGATFGDRPTALWIQVPTIQASPQTQTAEATSAVGLQVKASSPLPLFYFWYLNATNLLSSGTNWQLDLPNLQLSQSGACTVVISNLLGAVTSAPAMLNVIAPVERRPVPGVKMTGGAGSLWNVDYADSLSLAPNWITLGSVSLTSTPQYCFDVTMPLPPQRFYRALQTGTPGVRPSLALHPVPAITLTGTIGDSVRVDYINQFGPIDAWVTLETVTLTNTSQLYFDVSAPGQPQRLYRLVPSP